MDCKRHLCCCQSFFWKKFFNGSLYNGKMFIIP
nr:MAG TPA: Somatostatin/Cortistatin family [Bacteriophage sp.]